MRLSPTDIIESLLFASDKPLPLKKLAQILELPPREAQAELDILREEKDRFGATQIVEVAGGWQLVTKPQYSTHIKQLRDEKRPRLSRAAFEVLAIVAYRQPATRGDIESLRGVDCAAPVQFLLEKKLISFAGRKDSPGRPYLFATTPHFLDHFGLRDLADLPSLSELSQLNEAHIEDGDSLFNRGAMQNASSEIAEESTQESTPESGRTFAEDGAETVR